MIKVVIKEAWEEEVDRYQSYPRGHKAGLPTVGSGWGRTLGEEMKGDRTAHGTG
jgi:hypothetical protein